MELRKLVKVGQGSSAEVFRMGKYVLKCRRPYLSYIHSSLREEFEIHNQLFAAKIKVPKPYEILEVRLDNRTVQAIRMEFIDGKNIERMMMDKNRILAEKLYYNELDKAISLGFRPNDADLYNAIYSKNKGVYLIDFDKWERN